MILLRPLKVVATLIVATGVTVFFTSCTQAQTTLQACHVIDTISQEAAAQNRDESQQRKHLEISLQAVTNPHLKEHTDRILAELSSVKQQLSDLKTTTRSAKEEPVAQASQRVLKQASSAISAIKTQDIDRVCQSAQ